MFSTAHLPRALNRRFVASRADAGTLLLCAAIGAELVALAALVPATFAVWAHPQTEGFGDFPIFYRAAQSMQLNATYSPGLAVLMRPLTLLSMAAAFRVYLIVNALAAVGVAWVAQGAVRSLPAKLAVALGVVALPQAHWSLRVGHFSEVLSLAVLLSLLWSDRRPLLAGVLLSVLALKPQYLPVPLLYLIVTKNWRATAACIGALSALALAGVAALVLRDGPHALIHVASYYARAVPFLLGHATTGQQDQTYVQAWQYSWYGFLLSVGAPPNPIVAFELIGVSALAMFACWRYCTPSVAKAATVLGMLLVEPHATFYNWSIIAAAGALLLRSGLRPRALTPLLLAGLAVAAVATQNATPFPLPVDRFREAETRGFYWLQPAALAALVALAVAGAWSRRDTSSAVAADGAITGRPRRAWSRAPLLAGAGMAAVAAGVVGAAYASRTGPFAPGPLFPRAQVLAALPEDFPAPPGSLAGTGSGQRLPYAIDWRTDAPVSDVLGLMRVRLADGAWRVVDASEQDGVARVRGARSATDGAAALAEMEIRPDGAGARIRLEFVPLPPSRVPRYDRWLESIGIVARNVDGATPLPPLSTGR